MRPIRRVAATTVVVVLSSLLGACYFPPPPPPVDPAAAARTAAANWLVTKFDPVTNLIPSDFFPGPDLSGTAYAVTSLKIAGVGSSTAAAAVTALESKIEDFVDDGSGNDRPGSLARLILAVRSVGGDPTDFGGENLVARLEATLQPSGRFGVQPATYDGAFRQGLALAALSVVTADPAVVDAAADWLADQQCADGSWQPERTDLSEPCAFDPVTFAGPDTNSTAMAILGLTAVGRTPTIDPRPWLDSVRQPDGGWPFDDSGFSSTDPDSTGLVMAALRALGAPADGDALTALLSFQLSAPPADQGAFFYPPFSGPPVPNVLATNDAILGLSPAAWPGVLVS